MSSRVDLLFSIPRDTSLLDEQDSRVLDLKYRLYELRADIRIDHFIVFVSPELFNTLIPQTYKVFTFKELDCKTLSKHGIVIYVYSRFPRIPFGDGVYVESRPGHHVAYLNWSSDYDHYEAFSTGIYHKDHIDVFYETLRVRKMFSVIMASNRPHLLSDGLKEINDQLPKDWTAKHIQKDIYQNHLRTLHQLEEDISYVDWLEQTLIKLMIDASKKTSSDS